MDLNAKNTDSKKLKQLFDSVGLSVKIYMLTAQFFFFLDFDFEKKIFKKKPNKSSQKEEEKTTKNTSMLLLP